MHGDVSAKGLFDCYRVFFFERLFRLWLISSFFSFFHICVSCNLYSTLTTQDISFSYVSVFLIYERNILCVSWF
jgi:hypothetical protein